jgi:protein-S-isoprenylcysteine O-methyltransferase Ste14
MSDAFVESVCMAACALVSIALAFALGVWAHWRYALSRTAADVRATCRHHVWSKPFEVARHPSGLGTRYYKAVCVRCLAQRNVNADGSTYVPPRD